MFNKNYNTFSVIESINTLVFKVDEEDKRDIDANVFSVALIPRNELDVLQEDEEIEEKIFEENANSSQHMNSSHEEKKREEKQNPVEKVCTLRESLDPYFKDVEYSNDLIVIYDESNIEEVYCYTLNELRELFNSTIKRGEFDTIRLFRNYIFVKLPIWDIRIEIFSLLSLLQAGFNTIRLKQNRVDDFVFYIALSSSRSIFFPEENAKANIINSNDFITCTGIRKKGKEFYINKTIFQDDISFRTFWSKFEPNERIKRLAYEVAFEELTDGIPIMKEFVDNNQIGEYWLDDNKRPHRENDEPAVFHWSAPHRYYSSKQWRIHGLKHRDDDKPAVISEYINDYYNSDETKRSIRIKEEWWTEGKRNRVNQPAVIERLNNSDRIYFKEWWTNGVPELRVRVDADGTQTQVPFEDEHAEHAIEDDNPHPEDVVDNVNFN